MILKGIVCLFLVHIVFSDAIFLFLRRILRGVERPGTLRIFALTRGLGPAVVSVTAYFLLTFFPGREPSFYLVTTTVLLLVPGLMGLSELRELSSSYSRCFVLGGSVWRLPSGLASLVAGLVLLTSLFAVVYPLVEHDAISAAMETRIVIRDASLENYMAVWEPDSETGYYMENFRTPFLQTLHVFYGWALGEGDWEWPARWTSSVFFLHGLLLLAALLRRNHATRVVTWAAFLLAVTPIYFYMGYNNGIDTVRLYLLLVALAWIVELIESGSKRVAIAAGMASGVALFSHLLAAPSLAWGGLVHLFGARARKRDRLISSFVLAAVAFLAGAQYHYLMAPALVAQVDRSFGLTRIGKMLLPPKVRDPVEMRATRRAEEASASLEDPKGGQAERPVADPDAQSPITKAKGPSNAPGESFEMGGNSLSMPVVDQPGAGRIAIEPAERSVKAPASLLAVRGQGGTSVKGLVFGRLQMFTGIEYFGFLFWIASVALLVRILRRRETSTLGFVLSGAAALTALVVLSGLRKLSWSNPRYIATLMPMAVYIAAPLLCSLEAFLGRRRLGTAAMAIFLSLPVLLVTSIRGAKIEITNPGTFYSDFRSLRWAKALAESPGGSLDRFKNDYLGLPKSLAYLTADRDTQLKYAHDYFAAILWIRDTLTADVRVLVFRDARFFYYGGHKAVVWYSPEIDQRQFQYLITRSEEMHEFLLDQGITHVLVDDYSTRFPSYFDSAVEEMMLCESLVRKIFEYKTARVYELLAADPSPSKGGRPSP